MSQLAIILLAGGTGKRFGGATPKQYLQLQNKPILQHSLDLFANLPFVKELILVADTSFQELLVLPKNLPVRFASPGEERQDSVWNGLQAVEASTPYVAIHDGARPLITPALVTSLFQKAQEEGAAIPGIPLAFTIKTRNEDGTVRATPPRSDHFEIQTPQVMRTDWLRRAFAEANQRQVTDDASLLEAVDLPVHIVPGLLENIKITTPLDLLLAEKILEGNACTLTS